MVRAAFLCLAFAILVSAESQDKYTTKFDNIDVDGILRNERLLKPYLNCLLKEGSPCTAEARELKTLLPDAIASACSKCSEKQRQGAEKVIEHLSKKKPDVWDEILKKYDPEGVYMKKYKDQAEKLGITPKPSK